jgi:MFS family permease
MMPPAMRKAKMGAVIRAASGNFLALYDFLVYIYFAGYIAKAFFPAKSEFMSLMLALGTYGVASIARPFGAIILGSYMDRKGRRKGLILTLTLMAVGTVSLALTPSYASIGLLAPVVITLGRLIQGFSLGIEAGGVNVYLAEIATPGNRGFYCAWQGSSQALGVMAATALGVLLTATLSMPQMDSFGWRIPLIVGCQYPGRAARAANRGEAGPSGVFGVTDNRLRRLREHAGGKSVEFDSLALIVVAYRDRRIAVLLQAYGDAPAGGLGKQIRIAGEERSAIADPAFGVLIVAEIFRRIRDAQRDAAIAVRNNADGHDDRIAASFQCEA